MLITKPNKVSLTLLLILTLFLAFNPAEANSGVAHRRDHENLNRVLRKRSPQLLGAGEDPTKAAVSTAAATTSEADDEATTKAATTTSATSTSKTSTSTSTSTSATSTSTSSSFTSASTTSTSASTSSSATSSSSSSSSSTSSSSSSSPSTTSSSTTSSSSTTEAPQTTDATSDEVVIITDTANSSKKTVTQTATSSAAEETASVPLEQSGNTAKKSTAVTVMIIIAASVGGVFIIWTVFRKWKFGRSKQFDQRMQPIDWQPMNDDNSSAGLQRAASSASSFHSGMDHGDMADHGRAGLQPVPNHDFTAGAAHLAPVGGYADLARGPSPSPSMQEALHRGPSFNRGYDANVPLHHQTAYDYNAGSRF